MTTSLIMDRNPSSMAGSAGGWSPVSMVWLPTIRCGVGVLPAATVAAVSAMPNGVTRTLPWPNPSSVRSMRFTVAGTVPVTVVRPSMMKSAPIPYWEAASVSALGGIRLASSANVVLQELAKALDIGTVPRSNLL